MYVSQRIAELRGELAKMPLTPRVLVAKYAKKWDIGERQVNIYLARIRKELQADAVEAGPSQREEFVLQAREFYTAARAAKAWGPAGRALLLLQGLYGLAAPQKVELTGRDGAPVQVQRESVDGLNEAELAVLVRATEKLLGEAPKDEPEVH